MQDVSSQSRTFSYDRAAAVQRLREERAVLAKAAEKKKRETAKLRDGALKGVIAAKMGNPIPAIKFGLDLLGS